jgi:uncharacterized protein YoxC
LEELAFQVVEKTIVGGAFIYLLVHIIKDKAELSKNLAIFGDTLKDISHTLSNIDKSIQSLERRVSNLEDNKGGVK